MERMWRKVAVHLEGSMWVFRGSLVRTLKRWMFGGLERYLGIVGASTLKSGDSMGEVDLERLLDGWRSCLEMSRSCVPAEWTCVESYDNGACGGVRVVPVYTLIGS